MSRFRRYTSAQPPVSLVDRFLHQVQLQPDKPFVLFEDQLYTYKDVDVMSNKVANVFHGEVVTCGDTVAMLVYNEPAFIWTFLGLAKLGVKIALLNTNLRNKSLVHCFKAAEAKVLIVGQGLPKAAKVTVGRLSQAACSFGVSNVKANDVVYVTLPLYHSNALFAGLGGAIEYGHTLALARKFSATRFWDDCRKYNATIILYIGELLRYLCAQPKTPFDRNHSVRLAFGNGLRPDVWVKFRDRFGVGEIMEIYGSTEGNVSFINITNKTGAVGMLTPLLRRMNDRFKGASFLKVDPETNEPVRDQNARCIPVKPGEPGLLVGPVTDATPFVGYQGDRKLTDKKILRNVFKKGDTFFNTGDLMMMDKDYYVYFIDRLGDTYRWKGENVATTEVAEVLHDIEGVQEANVYGVIVPGHDGRAGMAAIVVHPGHLPNMWDWYAHLSSRLPGYARPLFLRLTQHLSHTTTFKQTKAELIKEGFDPNVVTDRLYFRDDSKKTYVPLDSEVYKAIAVGKAKL
uniref:long-chain-fatty-acid--CoA ligase n=1 Tax=Branchiostoma floridae TaxID=7739 RepID=C3XRF3_BRAFL|eukprot:XP_002613262.1 hypothetical protein BRAFLDRAFT_57365 [Branchiostoma floridae]